MDTAVDVEGVEELVFWAADQPREQLVVHWRWRCQRIFGIFNYKLAKIFKSNNCRFFSVKVLIINCCFKKQREYCKNVREISLRAFPVGTHTMKYFLASTASKL